LNALLELQTWYRSQCTGDWEHSRGVKIETLDNPGWLVTIDLQGTSLEGKPFQPCRRGEIANDLTESDDWLDCRVEAACFKGAGGPGKLEDVTAVLLVWARSGE
jgi:hypothetical protein